MKKILSLLFLSMFVHYILLAQPNDEYTNCINQYQQLFDKKEYAAAIPFVKKAASIIKAKAGEHDKNYIGLVNTTGTLFFFMTQYDSAIYYYNHTLALYNKYHGSDNSSKLQSQQNIALSYYKKKDYVNARQWYEMVVAGQKEIYGAEHDSYIISMGTLANIYKQLKLYEKAEDIMIQNIEYYKKHKLNSESHEIAVENLASLYEAWQIYYWAAITNWRAYDIRTKYIGKADDYSMKYLKNATFFFEKAGNEYKEEGDYEKAEECYSNNAYIFLRQNINNKEYARFCNLQGVMQMEMGNYEGAEINLFTALQVFTREFNDTHLAVGMVSNYIGSLYMALRMIHIAEPYYLKGYQIRKKVLANNHRDIAESCSNLGQLYSSLGKYEKAESFFLESLKVYESGIGTNNTYYAVTINNLAQLYIKQKKFDEAEKYYLQSLKLRKELQGEKHPAYARVLNNLGVFYLDRDNAAKAKTYLNDAVSVIQKRFGKKHPLYIAYTNNLALCNNDLGRYDEAKQMLLETNRFVSERTRQNFAILTEEEKEVYADELMYNAKFANSVLYNSKLFNKETLIDNFNQQLQLKGLVLSESKTMFESVRNTKDTSFQKLYSRYTYLKDQIAREYGLPIDNRSKELPDWEGEILIVEKDLLLQSVAFSNQKAKIDISYDKVKNSLQDGEVAIEFVKFNLYNKGETDSVMYVAYIVSKQQDAPIYVPLFEAKQLQQVMDSAGKTNQLMVSNLYRSSILKSKATNANFGKSLYSLIWLPLEPYLKNVTTVHYAPVDKLNSIAFNALAVDSGVYLIDRYKLYQHTSTRALCSRALSNKSTKNIVLFGNANFSLDEATMAAYEKAADSLVVKRGFDKGKARSVAWAALPGTAEEVQSIQQLFSSSKMNSKLYATTEANEENFKKLDKQPYSIIHMATHGFFLERIDESKLKNEQGSSHYNTAYNPMLRSGIVLSGANYAWNGGIVPKVKQDGIVTAFEISQLNLTQVELVVLSACETALGDIQGNEGVYGLQRAFKLAGVKNLIVSLWQVPDKETGELMTAFYSYYLKGMDLKEAFYTSQAGLRKKYSPFYWAAFNFID